jgi:hypothetical protein
MTTERCETCSALVDGGTLCNRCWEIQRRLADYLQNGGEAARSFVLGVLGPGPVTTQFQRFIARDVTITECQLRLREMGRGAADGLTADVSNEARAIAVKFGQHLDDAADALETLRPSQWATSDAQARLRQAGELAYLITMAAAAPSVGPGRFDSAGPPFEQFAKDLWNVLRFYELVGKEGATTG